MVEFSEVLQNKSGKRFIRSQSLSNCANYYHFEFKAHDSLNDALATLHCYKEIHKDDWLEDMKSSDGMWSF